MREIDKTYIGKGREISDMFCEENKEKVKKEIERLMKYKGGGVYGWKTLWRELDERTYGLKKGDLVVVAGRPKTGKTWFMLLLAIRAWKSGAKIIFFSEEMPQVQILKRVIAIMSGIGYDRLRRGKISESEFNKVNDLLNSINSDRFLISDRIYKLRDIEAVTRKNRPDIIFLDGVYLVSSKASVENLYEKVSLVCVRLKEIAKEEGLVVVVSTQFHKKLRRGKKGEVENLAFSDFTGMTADLVIGISVDKDMEFNKKWMISLIGNREGELVDVICNRDLEKMDFEQVGYIVGGEYKESDLRWEESDYFIVEGKI